MITATMFRDSTRQELTEEQEKLKREIYERMNPPPQEVHRPHRLR